MLRTLFSKRGVQPTKTTYLTTRLTSTTMPNNTTRPRRFAPVDPSHSNSSNAPKVKGLVFDVDGTLCLPQNYMFKEMRQVLSIPDSSDILAHVNSLSEVPEPGESESPRTKAKRAIEKIESQAMEDQQPQPGLNELITHLSKRSLHMALCTRNFELPVVHLLEKFVEGSARKGIWPLVTRDTEGVKAKPSPEGIWACVEAWERGEPDLPESRGETGSVLENMSDEDRLKSCEGVIMVGDSVDDIEAGARAGAATVLLVNEENKHLLDVQEWPKRIDLAIHRLDDLIEVLDKGFCGRD